MDETKTKVKKSLANEILDFDDERTEIVTVPEWGNKKILCKNLTGTDRAFLTRLLRDSTYEVTTADIILLGAYDPETGEKIFNPVQKDRLGSKNTKALELVGLTISRLSGISPEEAITIEKN